MKVAGFMVPAEKVVSVSPTDTVRAVMDLMLSKSIGAVVVIDKSEETKGLDADAETMSPIPIGIITKSDVIKGYQNGIKIDDVCEAIMFKGDLATCTPNVSRDKAARILEKNHFHHLVVTDEKQEHFLGLISSWDITAECARDDRAWPWPRSVDGKLHTPKVTKPRSTSPQHAEDHPTILNHDHGHDEFATYMDDLDLVAIQ
jgi:CBS domain-containing protein